jgi:hypothetical protein
MKTCSRCKTSKPYTDFNKESKSKDGYQYQCRQCKAALHQEHHAQRIESIKASQQKRVDAARTYVVQWFQTHPCVDCGNTDIRVLEFDHVSGQKVKGVARLVRDGYTLETVKREIAKCEVRCRNCHTIKTYERLGTTWYDAHLPS